MGHTARMSILTVLGLIAIALGILGLVGVIGTTLVAEIILIVVGICLIAYAQGRLRA